MHAIPGELPSGLQALPEWLPLGEPGRLLRSYLERLVIVPAQYTEKSQRCQDEAALSELDRTFIKVTDDTNEDPRKAELAGYFQVIGDVLATDSDLHDDDGIRWGDTSLALLDKGAQTTEHTTKRLTLTSALIASLFAEEPAERLRFIEAAYDTGTALDIWRLSARLSGQHVALLLGGYRDVTSTSNYSEVDPIAHLQTRRSVQKLGDFCHAFRLPQDIVAEYGQMARRNAEQKIEDPHKTLRRLVGAYAAGESLEEAVCPFAGAALASTPPYVDRWVFDPYKLQRVALQEVFLADVVEALFPGGSREPIKQLLIESRTATDGHSLKALSTAVHTAIRKLSDGVVRRYKGYDESVSSLSIEQQQAKAYKQLVTRAELLQTLMHYVDPTVSGVGYGHGNGEIYDIVQTAQLPGHTAWYLTGITTTARQAGTSTEDPEHTARTQIIQLRRRAAISLNDDQETVGAGHGLKRQMAPNRRALIQTGARLACAALRVNVPNKTRVEVVDGRHRGSEYTDLITALAEVMIDEAHERGLFTL